MSILEIGNLNAKAPSFRAREPSYDALARQY